jgi:hypothetical protein
MATRRVFNVLVDEAGRPLANVVVSIQLNSPRWLNAEAARVGGWGIRVQTDANGRWEASLKPNDLMDDPNSYYVVTEGVESSPPVGGLRRPVEYLIRVPPTGYTDPIWVHNLLITPPSVTPPATAVMSLGSDNQPQMTGDIRLLSGAGVELTQDTAAKTITINANQTLLDEQTHTDTATTVVQRGMLIVGRLIGTVIKWAGLALGAAGKFLKSTGTDVVWDDVDWTEVQNKPSTFPPSPHTHVKADITDFAHTHPLSDLQQSGALTNQVPKWSGTAWQAGYVDWTEVINKPTTFPPSAHTHVKADITDFAHTHPPDQIIPQGSGSGLDADMVDGQHASAFAPASHTHTKSQITDLETITTTPTANAVPKADASGKIAVGWIPQGSGSTLDADKLDGLDSTAFEKVANKGVANGYAPLDDNAKLPLSNLPSHTHNAANVAAGQFGANTGGGNYSFPGRVGIRTTTPQSDLNVVGMIRVDGVSGEGGVLAVTNASSGARVAFTVQNNLNNYIQMEIKGSAEVGTIFGLPFADLAYIRVMRVSGTAPFAIGTQYAGPLVFATSNAERMRIAPGGNVGIGTMAPNSRLHVAGSISVAITRRTANYTLTDADRIVACDASAGAFTVSLPSAAGIAGRMYTIKKVDSSPNAVTVAAPTGQTIDGAASYVLSAQWKYVTVVSDGSNWLIIANN